MAASRWSGISEKRLFVHVHLSTIYLHILVRVVRRVTAHNCPAWSLSSSFKSDLESLCLVSGGARSCLEFNLPSPQNTNTCYCTSVPTWGTALSTAGQWSCYLACGKHYPRSRWFCGCWICATIKGRPLFRQWKHAEFLRRFQAKEGCFISRILYIVLNIHTFGVQGTGYKTASTASPFDYN